MRSSRRSPRRRWHGFRVGLSAAVLAPLVALGMVVAGPVGNAAAATAFIGPADTWKMGDDFTWMEDWWWKCSGDAFNRVDGSAAAGYTHTVKVRGGCDAGGSWELAHGIGAGSGGWADFTVGVRVYGCLSNLSGQCGGFFPGQGCSGASSTTTDSAGRFSTGVEMNWDPVPDADGAPLWCEANEVCVSIVKSTAGNDVSEESCMDIALGEVTLPSVAPPPPGNCPVGSPGAVETSWRQTGTWYDKAFQVKIPWNANAAGSIQGRGMMAYVVTPNGATPYHVRTSQGFGPLTSQTLVLEMSSTHTDLPAGEFPTHASWGPPNVIGVQLFVNSSSWIVTDNHFAPPGQGASRLGRTNLSACEFWIGEKIINDPTSAEDEPYGFVGAPPEPDEPADPAPADPTDAGCGFEVGDPSTWASAGFCAVAGILKQIYDQLVKVVAAIGGLASKIAGAIAGALSGLADDIANAITGGLSALFIPDDMPDWGDIGSPVPDGWLPELPPLDGGGCGALTIPELQMGWDGRTFGPTTIVDTCDAPWTGARTVVYYGLLASLLVSVIWQAFDAVSTALGMNVAPARGGGDDD